MLKTRIVVTAIILGSIFSASLHADMVPIAKLYTHQCNSETACNHQDNQYTHYFNSNDFKFADDFHLSPNQFPTVSNTSEIPEKQNSIELKNEQSSLTLCLSALIGMGFCSSAHWMKKHSFGIIPQWYHSGGPHQIGHSFAVNPDLLSAAPTFCFIEPVYAGEDSIEQHRQRTVVSLWRNSQYTPTVLASRAPPNMS